MSVTDDRYTELVLEASVYEELRLRRGLLTRLPIAAKIGGCSVLAFIGATVGPIAALLPRAVREQYFDAAPTSTALSVTLLALFGCGCLLLASLGLTWIAHTRSPVDALSEDAAWRLVGLENIFTGIGFLTGGLGIFTAVGLASTGLFGVEMVDSLVALGVDPYQTGASVARTPLATSIVGIVTGIGTAALGLLVHRAVDDKETVVTEASHE